MSKEEKYIYLFADHIMLYLKKKKNQRTNDKTNSNSKRPC